MSDAAPIYYYIEGGSARLAATLLDETGAVVWPGDIRLLVLPPRSATSYEIALTQEGDQAVAIIALTTHGIWRYRFEATTEPFAVYENQFSVAARSVPALTGGPGPGDPGSSTGNWHIELLDGIGLLAMPDVVAVAQQDSPDVWVTRQADLSLLTEFVYDNQRKATDSVLGGVIAGTGLTIDVDGVLSATGGGGGGGDYTLPTATASVLGGIKVGDRLSISAGVLSADVQGGAYSLPTATASVLGGVKIGSRITIASGVISADVQAGTYALPTATASVLGGIKIGTGLSIDGSGVVSSSGSYTLPTASASVLGGVKVGTGLTITAGVLDATGGSYTLPTASASVLGGVKIGNYLTIISGFLSADQITASAVTLGQVRIGARITITASVISADLQSLSVLTDVDVGTPTGGQMLRYNDASSKWSAEDTPYVLKFSAAGTPVASQFLGGDYAVQSANFLGNFNGSRFRCKTAPTALFVINVNKNGTLCGTIRFAAAATTATFLTVSALPVALADGDYIELIAPATPDVTIEGIYGSLVGTRT